MLKALAARFFAFRFNAAPLNHAAALALPVPSVSRRLQDFRGGLGFASSANFKIVKFCLRKSKSFRP